MSVDLEIDRPIFVVGCGRSGTTLFYNILGGHPDLAWFSNYTQKWPQLPQLALLSRLYTVEFLRHRFGKRQPHPVEGYPIWDFCKPVPDSPDDPPLTEDDVLPEDIVRLRKMVKLHIRYQGKSRFINKNCRNGRRIRYLNKIFEDALFIHLIRDPRATIASLLRVNWWPDLRAWCKGHITPKEWSAQGQDPAMLAASLWFEEVQRILADKAVLGEDRYLEIHYEDFIARPKEVLSEVVSFSGLEWSSQFSKFVDSFALRNMNYKYKALFSQEQLAEIESLVAPLANCLGYKIPLGGSRN